MRVDMIMLNMIRLHISTADVTNRYFVKREREAMCFISLNTSLSHDPKPRFFTPTESDVKEPKSFSASLLL